MNWVITPYVLAMILVACITALVGAVAFKYRKTPGGLPIALMLFAITEWSLATAFEFAVIALPDKILWAKIEYVGMVYAPVCFLVFALEYANQTQWPHPRTLAFLCLIPTFTLVLALTNETHHLIWTSFTPSPAGNNLVVYGHGIGIWIAAVYYYLLVLAGTLALIQFALRFSHVYRRQALLILIATIPPWVGNILYMLDLSPAPGLDLSLLSFAFTGTLLAFNIIQYRMLDLQPIARDALIENMTDGVMVIDRANRIIDINSAALQFFKQERAALLGQPAQVALAQSRKWIDQFWKTPYVQTELTTNDIPPRHFDLRISTLRDRHEKPSGRLVVLRDVTELKAAEQELKQHLSELRTINEISQILASHVDLATMLHATGEKVRQILNAHSVFIALYNAETNLIHMPYCRIYDEFEQIAPFALGQGLTSHVIRNRQSLLINQDYATQSEQMGVVRIESTKHKGRPQSWLGVPMMIGDQVIGVLSAQNYEQENAFSENDVRLWTTIAANVSVAIRNVQLYGETSRAVEQMAALNRISLAVTEGLGMDRLLPTLHEQCKQIGSADVFYVGLYNESTHELNVIYFKDLDEALHTPLRDIRERPGLSGYLIRTRKTLYLPDSLDTSHPPPVAPNRTVGAKARAYLGVPLILRDHVLGVMSVQSYTPNAYSQQQIRMFEMFAAQVAIVIQNSQLYEQVQRLAITDELTGLPNRRLLFEKGESEVARAHRFGRPLSIVMLDIDHFKPVNDRYGHTIGDRVLREIAQVLRHFLRDSDTAARYGGEEFVVLLPETEAPLASLVAERLRTAIEDCYVEADAQEIHVTVSLGVAAVDKDTVDFSKLISHADQALYLSKHDGRNRVTIWNGETL
ncbi:MAG: diguanylate cyclase [Chloroflexi bacterium]|nr:diguanylate cyclase [Chloroflexota bacterium]